MMGGKTLAAPNLAMFTGTYRRYRHGINQTVLFTDGIKYVADNAGAYWLLDEIAIAQLCNEQIRKEAFQVWRLVVRPDRTATLTCDDGNGFVVLARELKFTDFPFEEITFWFTNDTIFLPSEY